MAVKLIAIDMDDTLLNEELEVTPRTAAAIKAAQLQGIEVAIATGRMHCSALPFALQLEMDVPIITYNGGMIRHPQREEMIWHQPIDAAVAAKIIELFKERGWYLQSYVNDRLYVVEHSREARTYEALANIKATALGEDFYTMHDAPTKMLAMAEPELLREIEDTVREKIGELVFTATSKPTYLELTHPEVNKGRALSILAAHLGIKQEEVMAIGDSNNDYPMLQYAGIGVAMGNASERIKSVAQFVTDDNENDGVAKAIEKVLAV